MARRRHRRSRRGFGIIYKIPKGAYQKALKKVQADARVIARYRSVDRRTGKRTGPAAVPVGKTKATNRDRSVVEVYRFQHRKKATPFVGYLKGTKITNWTGLRLCNVMSRVASRSGFPDVTGRRPERVSFHAHCIDGNDYVGTSPGDGMYARLRPRRGR